MKSQLTGVLALGLLLAALAGGVVRAGEVAPDSAEAYLVGNWQTVPPADNPAAVFRTAFLPDGSCRVIYAGRTYGFTFFAEGIYGQANGEPRVFYHITKINDRQIELRPDDRLESMTLHRCGEFGP